MVGAGLLVEMVAPDMAPVRPFNTFASAIWSGQPPGCRPKMGLGVGRGLALDAEALEVEVVVVVMEGLECTEVPGVSLLTGRLLVEDRRDRREFINYICGDAVRNGGLERFKE